MDMEEAGSALQERRCAVVTGANKGIGQAICRQLASEDIFVVLTARDEKRGCEAVANFQASGLSNVVFHQLDVTDPASIASLANFIHSRCKKLDILVNNAGDIGVVWHYEAYRALAAWREETNDDNADMRKAAITQTVEKAEEGLKTNYYGTKGVTEALLPFLQLSNSARIVNVSSLFGQLQFIPNEKIKAELNNVKCLTEERLDEILQWFLKDFKEDKLQANGWPMSNPAYKISKAAVNAYTRILAKRYPKMRINCLHPGYVNTDMTCNTGPLSPEEGARAPVRLALLPDDGPSGHYFLEMELSTF